MNTPDLLKFCQKTSRELRRILHEVNEDWGRHVKMGADGTPTSRVDQVAEDLVLRAIEEEGIEVNILSEELGFLYRKADVTLVLDPIDGTNNAVWGIPFYSISMAFGRERISDIFFGYVFNLANGDEYYAIKGEGSFFNGKRIIPRKGSPLEGIWMNSSIANNPNEFLKISSRLKGKARILGAASLELCLVATGALSYYYYPLERLRVVDIAAGQLIVKEAGGKVLKGDLTPLDLKLDLKERTSVFAFLGDLNEGRNIW